MAPSAKKLDAALADATFEIFSAEPDATSVNRVRRHVEEKLGLDDGFFATGDWKQRSKTLIKTQVDKLLDGWVPEPKKELESKSGIKRESPDAGSPESKRRKSVSNPKKPKKAESDLSDLDEEEAKPAKAKMLKKAAPEPRRRKSTSKPKESTKKEESDLGELEEDDLKPQGVKKAARDGKAKTGDSGADDAGVKSSPSEASPSPDRKRKRKVEDDSEEENTSKGSVAQKEKHLRANKASEDPEDVIKVVPKVTDDSDQDAKSTVKDGDTIVAIPEEEEYSDVIDEAPPPKRKKGKKDSSSQSSKHQKSASKKPSAAATPDNPHEAEVKKLQSQLAKCGIRRLWHVELKNYGDDARAKIRHLKTMLADVGMDGRFSEAKAREIKETRELLAEVEAAQEMDQLWGEGTGGRASRSKSKSAKIEESEASGGEEDEENDDDEDEQVSFAARRRRAQADLAFLGDESDSD